MKYFIFWSITPCSPLKVNQLFGEICRLHLQSRIKEAKYQAEEGSMQSCSTLKMDVKYSSETLVDIHRATRRYILLELITSQDYYKCVLFGRQPKKKTEWRTMVPRINVENAMAGG
jgi:hypothetical protein